MLNIEKKIKGFGYKGEDGKTNTKSILLDESHWTALDALAEHYGSSKSEVVYQILKLGLQSDLDYTSVKFDGPEKATTYYLSQERREEILKIFEGVQYTWKNIIGAGIDKAYMEIKESK